MEWAQIVISILTAVGNFIVDAIQKGGVDKALEVPLSDILPHDLKTTIAKRQADDEAAKKFGATP